jgi:Zn ribbon nucleic-acid-binding protein
LPRSTRCTLRPPMDTACKHPKVRVVAREEDVEYVECLDCGQVFDSNEFRDMEIEEEVLGEQEDLR